MKRPLLLTLSVSCLLAFRRHPSADGFVVATTTKTTTTTTTTGSGTILYSSRRFATILKDTPLSPQQQQQQQQQCFRKERTIRLPKSGREVTLISRTLPIDSNLLQNITVWEWKNPSEVVNAYWDAQTHQMTTMTASSSAFTSKDPSSNAPSLLDPFGLMTWPGSVKAAQELCRHIDAVQGRHVVVLGAGVGVETQAASILGAKQVISTDIHPTTLQQLQVGIDQEPRIPSDVVQTQILDLFAIDHQPLPTPCDLLVAADVLYNEQLAKQICRRCAEAYRRNPKIQLLITDSQRFVPTFIEDLNTALEAVAVAEGRNFEKVDWHVETMEGFTGSGVMIDDDQMYNVKVQHVWIGL
ncbi:lysine methyltransferase [Nitzschia inconspicua]|uniref:Lysine methyltransferase n=1 Tax=Nitzschia inconspicua TaxID=303405 RepID=A0A9K3LII0_9STRA|nr:lysine methyltransferase [Nitzschia inconspicua]